MLIQSHCTGDKVLNAPPLKDPDFGEFGGRLLILIFQNLKILGALINFDFFSEMEGGAY